MMLPKTYDFDSTEKRIYKMWEENGYFKPCNDPHDQDFDPDIENYVISIPPPNVTGKLHLGHPLFVSLEDLMIRYHRMKGYSTLWVPGTDHAGIATQLQVEKKLREEGTSRKEIGREKFLERTWQWKEEHSGLITEQIRRLGASCDWDRERFTMDEGLSNAVREAFVHLYEKGLIYRGPRLINWSPALQTAVSDLEVEHEEEKGTLYYFKYRIADSEGDYIPVATTRPETILGDAAVAVHPEDERFQEYVGKNALVPILNREIPVIADDYVDLDFGTGALKITPGHDPNDYEIGMRHGLEVYSMLDKEGKVTDVGGRYQGQDRFEARKNLWEDMRKEDLVIKEEPYVHQVPRAQRGGEIIEPMVSTQWFVDIQPLAEKALKAVKEGEIEIVPERFKKVYYNWMENIHDWCISRQLWWGHRIPVWYCADCDQITVKREDPTACEHCGSEDIQQDPDVLDTWFSSWLWPFSVFGWPEETDDLRAFYPGHSLVTAPEILFFWVARMVMAGYEFRGEAPFRDIFLHGTVRDAQGRKMSKSLGNGIDPIEVVEHFGADALRYTVLSMCGVGTDIHLDHEDLEAAFAPGRNFANKLWNAGRFTLMSVGDEPVRAVDDVEAFLALEDRWILSRLSGTAAAMTRELERFRLHEAVDRIHHFFWGDFADWYLEMSKTRLRDEHDKESRQAARAVLVHVFDGILRLLHPLVPFVTEHLWDRIPWPEGRDRPERLSVAPWPESEPARESEDAEQGMARLQELVTTVRSLRKEYGVGEGAPVELVLKGAPGPFREVLDGTDALLEALARVRAIEYGNPEGRGAGATAVLKNGTEVFLPLEGLVDLQAERERLRAEIERLTDQLAGAERKLANEQFVTKAPEAVVQKERDKAATFRDQRDKLREKIRTLGDG